MGMVIIINDNPIFPSMPPLILDDHIAPFPLKKSTTSSVGIRLETQCFWKWKAWQPKHQPIFKYFWEGPIPRLRDGMCIKWSSCGPCQNTKTIKVNYHRLPHLGALYSGNVALPALARRRSTACAWPEIRHETMP